METDYNELKEKVKLAIEKEKIEYISENIVKRNKFVKWLWEQDALSYQSRSKGIRLSTYDDNVFEFHDCFLTQLFKIQKKLAALGIEYTLNVSASYENYHTITLTLYNVDL